MAANSQQRSEASLVEAARRGDVESFGRLYERYHSPMVALAYSILGDRHHAEDAAQEAFAVACRDLSTLKRKERFAAWLAGICRNVSRQMLRRMARTSAVVPERVSEPRDEREQRQEAIRRAVWNLKLAERELVVMRYFDGFSQARISDVLGLSTQAVNGRLVRAKRKIAKSLEQSGLTGDDYEIS